MRCTIVLHVSQADVEQSNQRFRYADNEVEFRVHGEQVCGLDLLPLYLGFVKGMVSCHNTNR